MANGNNLPVQVLCQTVDGCTHKLVEMEMYPAYCLAQNGIKRLAFIGFQEIDNARYKVGRCRQAYCGIHSSTEHHQTKWLILASQYFASEFLTIEILVLSHCIGSNLIGSVVDIK